MGAMGSLWWLYVWLFWSAFNLLVMFVYPTWIAPLFNKFSPLEDGEMKRCIEALLTRCGFRSSGLFVMDGSKRSSHGNAYFTGFGNNKRIVFFDTLLNAWRPPRSRPCWPTNWAISGAIM
jgi:STE24 endopeptidase